MRRLLRMAGPSDMVDSSEGVPGNEWGARMRIKLLAAAAAAALSLAASPALADITIVEGNVPGNLDTILFDANDDGSDFFLLGLSDDGWTVQLEGAENIIGTGGPSQAWVVGTADGGLTTLTVTTPGAYFTAAEFRINVPGGGGPPAPWDITIEAFDNGNVFFTNGFLDITNDSFFNVFATNGQLIKSITFRIDDGPEVALGQLRLGGIQAIPEPATWAMMIMGFGGVGALMRRRRTATAFA